MNFPKKSGFIYFLMISACFGVAMPHLASADSGGIPNSGGYFGGLLGAGINTGSAGGSQILLGLNGGTKLPVPFGFGGFFQYYSVGSTPEVGGSKNGTSVSTTQFGAEGSYFFDDYAPGLSAGLKAGMEIASPNTYVLGVKQTSDSATSLIVGPRVGYDFPIAGQVSFGGEANLIFSTQSGSSAVINFLGALKFWF